MKIGLIAVSGKPYHIGHDMLIKKAADENDRVLLFVSTSDRKRPGEITINGITMHKIWDHYIEPTLPPNVNVSYGGSPVGKIYETLGKANETGSNDEFNVYGDTKDTLTNFPDASLKKYAGNIYAAGQIHLVPVSRMSTVNVSGTEMRRYLATNDKESFIKKLPQNINGGAIWHLLQNNQTTESLVRKFVSLLLSISSAHQ